MEEEQEEGEGKGGEVKEKHGPERRKKRRRKRRREEGGRRRKPKRLEEGKGRMVKGGDRIRTRRNNSQSRKGVPWGHRGTGAQMAQWVKTPPAMPDNLSSTPRTHLVGAEN